MYIHTKKKEAFIVIDYLIAFIPLIIYGIYKNGYLIYQKGLIDFFAIFKPLIFIGISLIGYTIYIYLKEKRFKLNYELINYLVFSLIFSSNTNYLIYTIGIILLIILNLVFKDSKFNEVALLKILLVGLLIAKFNYTYANILEANYSYSYNYWDLLMGHQIGAWATTSFVLILISLIFLIYQKSIKGIIPVFSYLFYFIFTALYLLISQKFNFYLLFNPNILFAFVFVASNYFHTPNARKYQFLYSLLLGILTVIFTNILNYNEGVFLAIFLLSILNKGLSTWNLKKYLKK